MPTLTPEWLSQHIVHKAPEAIIFADQQGVIRLWNEGATAIFGYSVEEAVGQNLDLIIPERHRGRHWEGYRRVMETGVTRYGAADLLAVPALRKDGTRISLEFSIVLVRDEQDRLRGIAAIMRDVTKRWQQERERQARLAALEAKSNK
ncbi:MAG TPA: PAS domain S-box protein [Methylomirabilota bacterium]|jgi:PAS domain S-box-containing protein|nr:PAS domain S-box protein [Methylomirabilota bacterium]